MLHPLGVDCLQSNRLLTRAAQYWGLVWVVAVAVLGQRLPGFAQEMLGAHNAVRRRVGVAPFEWSEQLQRSAQEWAGELIKSGEFSPRRNQPYGQNLFEISGGLATPYEVVSAWAAESRNYDYRTNTCSGRCGHYTQVVWRDSRLVGCGVARSRQREVWVCDYEPHGNVIGERPY